MFLSLKNKTKALGSFAGWHTRKVKVMKKPKFDITKLMELHQGGGEDEGAALGRPEGDDAQNALSAEIAAEAEVAAEAPVAMNSCETHTMFVWKGSHSIYERPTNASGSPCDP